MTLGAARLDLPDFPWDSLNGAIQRAAQHPGGAVDLSIGTPVDPVPDVVRAALQSVSALPGYPTTHGTPELREAAVAALERRYGVTGVPAEAVLPTVGSKELVAWLPTLLGLGPGDVVALPELAYPTYEVGARLAGATAVRLADSEPAVPGTRLRWLNSPGNPTGDVAPAGVLTAAVRQAREIGAVVASDECYLALGWEAQPSSVLHPHVCGGDHSGLLAVHSLSKSSNLAGYRAGFVAGDLALVTALLAVRRHAGMIVPRPVQQAMVAALSDDTHIAQQRDRYARRRVASGTVRRWAVPVVHCGRAVLGHRGAAGRGRCTRCPRRVLRSLRRAARPGRADRERRADRRRGAAAGRAVVTVGTQRASPGEGFCCGTGS
jgi:succinyldiaminopimelate transaminase